MTKKASTPALRFKGFTYTWKQRKLSDQFSDFIVPMRDKPKKFGGNIPWTRIEDIEGKYLNGSLSGQFVSKDTIKQMNLKIIPKDSLIVSSSATFGVVAIITQDLITNQTFIGLVPNDKETLDFWYTFFHSNEARNYMRLQSAGSTIFYIAREHFEKMPIIIPFKDEMITIGKYFSNLDRLITLHQRKYDKLTNMKKSMLEKMFPKNGANVPEIRFKGFTDAWEQRKLGEAVQEVTRNDATSDAPIMMITANNGFIEQSERYAFNNAGESLKKYILLEKGELAYNHGASKLRPYGSCFTLTTSENARIPFVYHCFSADEQNSEFLSIELNGADVENQLRRIVSSGARMDGLLNISFQEYVSVSVLLPTIEEQNKIADFFKNLDRLITLHQSELEKLKNLKKACLEKMFV